MIRGATCMFGDLGFLSNNIDDIYITTQQLLRADLFIIKLVALSCPKIYFSCA